MGDASDHKFARLDERLDVLADQAGGNYYSRRILAQLRYAAGMTQIDDRIALKTVLDAVSQVERFTAKHGAITAPACAEVEESLHDLVVPLKKYTVVLAAHAHIDMNWMWGWHETVVVTIETVRTVLKLMNRYPEFIFSQSQASVYEILERYEPDLLAGVCSRIREGRWEVTASQWVETDTNMISGESLIRQTTRARRYLGDLLHIDVSDLDLLFLPDSFGHSATMPAILSEMGVRYFYHCRGSAGPPVYRWKADNGRYLLTYLDPRWYNLSVDASLFDFLPEYFAATGLPTALTVYGVGDHGGGPTERDIVRLLDMRSWPIFPTLQFGRYHDFFGSVEKYGDRIPLVTGERNRVFTGCYTSQSRIKAANARTERSLYATEVALTLAAVAEGIPVAEDDLELPWRQCLFNQFHDILPGSGVRETREYALAGTQEVLARTLTMRMRALRALTEGHDAGGYSAETASRQVGPSGYDNVDTAEGAGVGLSVNEEHVSVVSRKMGEDRRFTVFNQLSFCREVLCRIVLWDWMHPLDSIICWDSEGERLPHQVVGRGTDEHWGHHYVVLLVACAIPGFAGRMVSVSPSQEHRNSSATVNRREFHPYGVDYWLTEPEAIYVLENELVRIEFESQTFSVRSWQDKRFGYACVPEGEHWPLLYETREAPTRGSSWVIGRYSSIEPLAGRSELIEYAHEGDLCRWIRFRLFGDLASATVTCTLAAGSPLLSVEISVDHLALGGPETGVPGLELSLPLGNDASEALSFVPHGTVRRRIGEQDFPSLGFASGRSIVPELEAAIFAPGKYGFRASTGKLSVNLLRNSYDPDPFPENGRSETRLSLGFIASDTSFSRIWRTALVHAFDPEVISTVGAKEFKPIQIDSEHLIATALKLVDFEAQSRRSVVLRLLNLESTDHFADIRVEAGVDHCERVRHDEAFDRELESAITRIDRYTIRVEVGARECNTFVIHLPAGGGRFHG